jgi:hypothetical protein
LSKARRKASELTLTFSPLPERLCRNDVEGEVQMEQTVRFISFRMRLLKLGVIVLFVNTIHFMGLES